MRARALDPIAEVNVRKSNRARARDVVENHEGAERARRLVGVEERVDHGEAVAEHVGERDREQFSAAARVDGGIGTAAPVFDHTGFDMAVLYHDGVIEHRHIRHPAVAVARVEIGAEHRILLGGRHRGAHFAHEIAVTVENSPHAPRRSKILRHDPDRDAGAAVLAGRPIGDRLAAAEAAVGQQIVELGGPLADEMREHLALLLARQIRAGRGRGEIELRRVA